MSPPGPGEAIVRHTAIGLNFVEVYFRRGTFQAPALPAVLGNEGAGVVEAVGPGVKDVSVGDRVVYADGPLGAYATARIYPADRLVRIPDGVSDIQAAASFLRGVTARMLLKEVVPLQSDDVVLFHAAAGGVGLLFAQWARALGVRVIGTVSNDAKAAAARQAGCIEVIDYAKEDFLARVRDLTGGEGVAAVFDSIGRDTFMKSWRCYGRAAYWSRLATRQAVRLRLTRFFWPRRRCTSLGRGGTYTQRADSSSRRAPPICLTPSARAFWKSVRAARTHSRTSSQRIAISKAGRLSEPR